VPILGVVHWAHHGFVNAGNGKSFCDAILAKEWSRRRGSILISRGIETVIHYRVAALLLVGHGDLA
jgi:hypothetical protein